MRRTPDTLRAEQAKKKAAYQRLFSSPDAEMVLYDLNEVFNKSTLKKQGGVVDSYASIAAAGSREVLLYIDNMMETDNDATAQ